MRKPLAHLMVSLRVVKGIVNKIMKLKNSALALLISLSCLTPVLAADSSNLPDIGTVAGATLSIDQERLYGDAYMRMLRNHQPIIEDPVLTEYISSLGHKLVAHASDVKTPFTFILIRNKEINAFAFFGGYVALHSGLFLHTQSESELASVMAHEIAHVTQRHLARSMEEQAKRSPATMAALAGSLLLAIAAPEAGIAALTATNAGNIQSQINYTRSNEKEADRIGIDTLAKSGFAPTAMPAFFGRLANEYRYSSTPPAMLLTHPLPEDRITDSRARARSYPHVSEPPSLDFQLAKARIVVRYSGLNDVNALDWLERQKRTQPKELEAAVEYGKALVYLNSNKVTQAATILNDLLKTDPNNHFYIDAMSDVYIAQKKYDQAIEQLKKALIQSPKNQVLRVNMANVFVQKKDYTNAIKILRRYTHDYPDSIIGWQLLSEACAHVSDQDEDLAARAELFALKADWNKAIQYYTQASQLAPLGSLTQARYDARIDQLMEQRDQYLALQK
jgi:beta-barrel assembly-enhancing protease